MPPYVSGDAFLQAPALARLPAHALAGSRFLLPRRPPPSPPFRFRPGSSVCSCTSSDLSQCQHTLSCYDSWSCDATTTSGLPGCTRCKSGAWGQAALCQACIT